MRKLTLFLALTTLLACETVIAKGDAEAGKIKAYTCSGCHGIPGYKNVYPTYNVPRLGGQNEKYLVSSLNAYRSGERAHPTMRLQAESLSAQDIEDISARITSLKPVASEQPANTDNVEPEKLQLCQTCHGADGRGIDDSYPVLAGQYASYMERALTDYRDGSRINPIMKGFSASLSDQDIEELASWYASMEGLKDLSGY